LSLLCLDKTFHQTLYHFFNTFQNHRTEEPNYNSKDECREWIYNNLIDLFVLIKGIKTPNNYRRLISICYPTKPFLKRNDNKLIAAILDRLGIKSKQTIKILHQIPNADIRGLFRLKRYFGDGLFKYLSNIDVRLFDETLPTKVSPYNNNFYKEKVTYENTFDLNDTEKYNLIKLFEEFSKNNENNHRLESVFNSQLNQVDDHFHMIKKLRDYYPDIMMRAKTWQEFHNEHLELSRLDRLIKKGSVIEYVFDEKLISTIEEPIKVWELDGIVHNEKYRKSNVKWIYFSEETKWIFVKLMKLIQVTNNEHWVFDLVMAREPIQYTEYTDDGHYDWHIRRRWWIYESKKSIRFCFIIRP